MKILKTLEALYLYDVGVLCTPWVYLFVFPAIFYVVFMSIKWSVLTLPIWLPITLATQHWKTVIYKGDK